jgi:hypothetical protein
MRRGAGVRQVGGALVNGAHARADERKIKGPEHPAPAPETMRRGER